MEISKLLSHFEGNEENMNYYLGLRQAIESLREKGEECSCDPRDQLVIERITQLKWVPKRILKPTEDIVYLNGNLYGYTSKQTAVDEDIGDGGTVGEGSSDQNGDSVQASFLCGVQGCSQRFVSLSMYESHYHNCHNFVCATCKRPFVSSFLLDVHLQENHDSYFQILSSRIDMYRCLVESCVLKFRSPEERKEHLIKQHKFPANFSFHQPLTSKKSKGKKLISAKDDDEMECVDASPSHPPPPLPLSSSSTPLPTVPPFPLPNAVLVTDMDIGGESHIQHPQTSKRSVAKGTGTHRRGGRGRQKQMVPPTVCFGRGSQRAFHRFGRGARGRHWHQTGHTNVDTAVDIEKMDFADMAESLDECKKSSTE